MGDGVNTPILVCPLSIRKWGSAQKAQVAKDGSLRKALKKESHGGLVEGNDTTEGLLILIANPILEVSAEASAPQPPGSRTVQKTGWTQMSLEIMEAVTKIVHIRENASLDLSSGLRARGEGIGI